MILGLTNLSFTDESFKVFVKEVKNLKFKYIEVAPFVIKREPFLNKNISKLREILVNEKLKVVSMQSIFFPHKKKLNQKDLKNYLYKVFQFAKKLKIKNISIGNTPYRKDRSKNVENINLVFFKIALYFAKKFILS